MYKDFEELSDELRKLLGEDELEKVAQNLRELLASLEGTFYQHIIMHSRRLSALRRHELGGMLSFDVILRERSTICKGLYDLLDELETDAQFLDFFRRLNETWTKTRSGRRDITEDIIRLVTLDNRSAMPDLLLTGETFVGRSPECELVLHDPHISRRHARLFVENESVWLEDLKSLNGTYLNDRPIQKGVLTDGCSIRFHDIRFEVELKKA